MFAEVILPSRMLKADDSKTINIEFCFDTGSTAFTFWSGDLMQLGWKDITKLETDYEGLMAKVNG